MSQHSFLHNQAEDFANEISELLNATVSKNVALKTSAIGADVFWIGPSEKPATAKNLPPIELLSGPKANGVPQLGMSVRFKLGFEAVERRLVALDSVIAINALTNPIRPIARWEYVRDGGIEPGIVSKKRHRRQAAHLHVHGHSEDLLTLFRTADVPHLEALSGRLENLHFPVGGRRFRPSLEDILEFLEKHKIITGFHTGGSAVLERSREQWLRQQLRAAVVDDLHTAISVIRELGFEVTKRGI